MKQIISFALHHHAKYALRVQKCVSVLLLIMDTNPLRRDNPASHMTMQSGGSV